MSAKENYFPQYMHCCGGPLLSITLTSCLYVHTRTTHLIISTFIKMLILTIMQQKYIHSQYIHAFLKRIFEIFNCSFHFDKGWGWPHGFVLFQKCSSTRILQHFSVEERQKRLEVQVQCVGGAKLLFLHTPQQMCICTPDMGTASAAWGPALAWNKALFGWPEAWLDFRVPLGH